MGNSLALKYPLLCFIVDFVLVELVLWYSVMKLTISSFLCYYSSSFIRFVCINLIIFWLLLCKTDSSQFPIFLILKLSSILLVSGFVDFLDQLQ